MKGKNWLVSAALLLALSLVVPSPPAVAQCPMCKISAESNLKNGGTQGKGLNAGILYMLATPYLLIGGLAFYWWRNRRRSEEDLEESDNAY